MSDQTSAPTTDESLLIRIRNPQDEAAWKMFVDLYLPAVYGYCRRLGLQDANAQDASQEAFSRVSRAIRQFEYDPAKGRFRAWLGTIVRQQAIRQRRQGARPGLAPGEGADDSQLEAMPADNDPQWLEEFNTRVCQAALERVQAEFDELSWRAFQLTWKDQRTPDEAAELLSKPKSWIYLAKFRVLKRLKEEVLFLTDDIAFFQQ